MSKGAYIGVNGVAKKVKGSYIGVDNVAKKIDKIYVGIGGVARLYFDSNSSGGLTYYGTITSLNTPLDKLSATTVGNYALFGGGRTSSYSNVMTAYNASLTRSTPTALSSARTTLAAATIGNYALFAGGYISASNSVVDAYNTSLTRTTPTALSKARYQLGATTIGNYALFGGGYNGNYLPIVDAYDVSLTRSTSTELSLARRRLDATTVGNYALFGGGHNYNGASSVVDAYNASLTRSTPTALSKARYRLAATTIGNYALFGGGAYTDSTYSADVDAYVASHPIQPSLVNITVHASDDGTSLSGLLTKGVLTVASNKITSSSTSLTVSPKVEVSYTLTSSLAIARTVVVNDITLGKASASGDTLSTTVDVSNGDTITILFKR